MNKFNPQSVSGEQFASMLDITISGNVAKVTFPCGRKAKGTKKAWSEDQYSASQTLIDSAGGYFQLIACARQKICTAITNNGIESGE
jgi:hypothetical protein